MEDRELSTAEYYTVLRPSQTAELVGYSTVHLGRLEKQGLFPKRFKLNASGGAYGAAGHYFGWVVDYLNSRVAKRAEDSAAVHDFLKSQATKRATKRAAARAARAAERDAPGEPEAA